MVDPTRGDGLSTVDTVKQKLTVKDVIYDYVEHYPYSTAPYTIFISEPDYSTYDVYHTIS
jgi:hypothetical protein